LKRFLMLLVTPLFLISPIGQAVEAPFVTEINGQLCQISDYSKIESAFMELLDVAGNEDVVLYDSSDLTHEVLESRNGKTVVERCIGMVTNKQRGDGMILNAADKRYSYISYRGIYRPISDGTVILSYMVYNPGNNHIDDIVERYDFIIDRTWED